MKHKREYDKEFLSMGVISGIMIILQLITLYAILK